MNPEQERRVETLFHRALLLRSTERAAWLARECADDPALRTEVERLLRADARVASEFLERRDDANSQAHEPGQRLGDYTLIERLGEGGMGVVYLARDEALGRKVALKIVRPDLLHFSQARERLRREIEAVARLKHPNILPVYSAGEERGVPFFAMELVEGCSLSELLAFLNRRRPAELTAAALSDALEELARNTEGQRPPRRAEAQFGATWTEACIRIALALAEALEHSHERGILHRDVKASNVMLTRDGRVLLVDFGLASSSEASALTRSGVALGTLPYMSPEQVRGESSTVGALSDVYALGVTLFELFTLRSPYQAPNGEVLRRRILEGNPPSIRSLNPHVPWDAETVCLTAMERDPARRYASAAALAEDLANLLAHRPIRARAPGPLLRGRRFVERHPVASVAAALGLLLCAGAVDFGVVQAAANRELRRANSEKSTALARREEINRILRSMLTAPDPWKVDQGDPIARDTLVVDVLERVRADLGSGRALDPAVEAEVSQLLGATYVELEMFTEAEPLLERALELARQLYGPESEASIRAAVKLAVLHYGQRRIDEAAALLETALASAERLRPLDEALVRLILNDLSNVCGESGQEARAEELLRRILRMLEHPANTGEELELALANHNLGSLLVVTGAREEGVERLEQALEVRRRLLPPGHANILMTEGSLGFGWIHLRRFAEAAELLEQTAHQMAQVFGETHEWTLYARVNLAWANVELRRFAEAEAQARAILAHEAGVRRPGHPVPIGARLRLASSLLGQGRVLEATALAEEAVELASAGNARYQAIARAVQERVRAKLVECEPKLVDELLALQAEHGPVHAATNGKLRELAAVLLALGRAEEAGLLLEEALFAWRDAFPEGSAEVALLEQELERCSKAAH